MLNFLPKPLIGLLSTILYIMNTLFWFIPIIVFSLLKAIISFSSWQKIISYLLDACASGWVAINIVIQKIFIKTQFNVTGIDNVSMKDWCLVLSNHQSWVDIMVLQRLLHGKVPFLKFFLKQELLYIPILGLAWWALDFPFMKRYSQSYLRKNPHLLGKDIETTRKACAKFKHKPVSVMNFIEGTRFTDAKHKQQKSPFEYLMRPKPGGIAFVFDAMGQHLTKLVNVTIHYPEGIPTFSDYLCGRVITINVDVQVSDIDQALIGDYFKDKQFKHNFQQKVNQLWIEKDKKMAEFNQNNNG
jgi:1-acyl-sn-glycerol-3-phosphate acyltransferase